MQFKNITLIEPRALSGHVYSFVKMPRLGLPLLGTILKDLGYKVKLLYGSSRDIRVSDISDADLVGVSTTTSTCREAYSIARYARSKGITVVIGGVHAAFMPEEALQYADYVLCGEAENSFPQLIKHLEKGEPPFNVPGAVFYAGGRLIKNPWPEPAHIQQLPAPDLSLFANLGRLKVYPLMTSRGCPHDCTFCSVTSMFGHRYRYREPEQILEELRQYRGKKVFFCDDNFTASPQRSKELLRGMIEKQVLPGWWGTQVRTDAARDDELLRLLRDANCGMVYVGLESINPRTLQAYNKKQNVDDIEYCIRRFHEYGIMVHGMFIFGSDEDNIDTIRNTVDFSLQTGIDTVQYMILVPLPGTRLFNKLEQEGRLLSRDWSFYDGHHVVFKPAQMPAVELQRETVRAFKSFYALSNLHRNILISGRKSAELRLAGYYLSRKWERERGWYYHFLESLCGPGAPAESGIRLHKTVESYKFKRFHYLAREKLIDMEIMEQNGSFNIAIAGYLNGFALAETIRTVKNIMPRNYRDLTINIEQLGFASEKVLRRFIKELDNLAFRARSLRLKTPPGSAGLHRVLEKYNCSLPYFEI